jgi:hypothetical protein
MKVEERLLTSVLLLDMAWEEESARALSITPSPPAMPGERVGVRGQLSQGDQ